MKRKTIITLFAVLLALTLSFSMLTACNNNKHDFAEEWKFDSTGHWHECTTKGHTDTSEKANHTVGAGEVTKEPTEEEDGEKTFICTVCGYRKTESIPALEHTHKFDNNVWEKDETNHWHPATCGHTDQKGSMEAHVWNDGEVTKPADYGVVGEKKFTCTKCGYEKTETIDALDAKDNEIKLVEGKTLGKEYDGEVVSITKGDFVIEGNRTPAFMFKVKGADDNTYAATAPKKAGEYTVKISVEGTAEWKATTKTFDFAITPMVIGVDWESEYNNSNILTGEPAELIYGDEAMITVTMESANVGAAVKSFEITGKDAANYSLHREDVNVEIVKAEIVNLEISNAAAFEKGFYVGATNIPDPTTNYVEIGTGYGERTIVWEMQLESGVWSRNLTKEEVLGSKTGTFQVRIKYAEGDNYKYGATPSLRFTLNTKPRTLTVRNFEGKMYDGKQVTNFTFDNLIKKFGATTPDGVENFMPATDSGEKYVEFREVGGEWGRNLNVANVLTNAGEYEYRIGVTATDEWEAVVSEVKTFTIKPYEFVLELGYGQNQNNESLDGGKTFILRIFNKTNGNELIEGQRIELWLDNEKAGLETREGSYSVYYFVPDRKKIVSKDCFFLKIGNVTNANMENYKIFTKSPSVTTVEMTVVEYTTEKSTSGSIDTFHPTENWLRTTVVKGYFKVGQTVVVYKKVIVDGSATYVKAGEATITAIRANNAISPSGFAIPSDGKVIIVLDKIYDDILSGKIEVK